MIKQSIKLVAAVAILSLTTYAQAAVLYSNTFNMGSTKGSFNAFGVIQNQIGGSASQVWVFYADNFQYSTQSGSTVTQEYQSFNSAVSAGAAGWSGNAAATTAPNNFGYSNTSFAGGSADEFGGTVSRGAANRGYYADTTVGTIDMAQDLYATGMINLYNGSAANNTFYLGWLDLSTLTTARRLGFYITESNVNLATDARITIGQASTGGTTSSATTNVVNIQNKVLYWSLSYNASTNELTGLIQDTPIPEPASMMLFGLGAALILRRKH